jgi:hypothetical protein
MNDGSPQTKWSDIRRRHPDKFILLGDIVEEKISETKSKILAGKVLKTSNDPKEIRRVYQECRKKGMNVLYSLPSTSDNFIVEDILSRRTHHAQTTHRQARP